MKDLYAQAWTKTMMGHALNSQENQEFERINKNMTNAFTHDTTNTQIFIPESVVAGIFKRAEEAYPFFGDAKKYDVRGKFTINKHAAILAGDARWYVENEEVEDEENEFGELVLNGHELSKAVSVSWKLREMGPEDFLEFIVNELADRVGVALGRASVIGTGAGQPEGVRTALLAEAGTPQVINYSAAEGLKYQDVTKAIAALHPSYTQQAAVYANNETIWTRLANVVDGSGRPYFIPHPTTDSVGKMFGFDLKADASIPVGEILIGNPEKGYVVNTNQPFTVVTEEHAKARTTDYVAYSIVDGGTVDTKAFALIAPAV